MSLLCFLFSAFCCPAGLSPLCLLVPGWPVPLSLCFPSVPSFLCHMVYPGLTSGPGPPLIHLTSLFELKKIPFLKSTIFIQFYNLEGPLWSRCWLCAQTPLSPTQHPMPSVCLTLAPHILDTPLPPTFQHLL